MAQRKLMRENKKTIHSFYTFKNYFQLCRGRSIRAMEMSVIHDERARGTLLLAPRKGAKEKSRKDPSSIHRTTQLANDLTRLPASRPKCTMCRVSLNPEQTSPKRSQKQPLFHISTYHGNRPKIPIEHEVSFFSLTQITRQSVLHDRRPNRFDSYPISPCLTASVPQYLKITSPKSFPLYLYLMFNDCWCGPWPWHAHPCC
jgi:hypothetical protein